MRNQVPGSQDGESKLDLYYTYKSMITSMMGGLAKLSTPEYHLWEYKEGGCTLIIFVYNTMAHNYPTGQNYSLELKFAKFTTAKSREKLDTLTFSFSGAVCLKTTLEKGVTVKRVHSDWDSNLQPPDYKTGYKSDALAQSYRDS